MSGYGKKKEEEVVKTPPPIDYQQFVGDSTGTAAQNYNAGNAYAEWLRDSAYKSAEAATAEANRLAAKQYERTVIDSQSSYQKAIGAYGSNAEALASRGLSGSGYGEWLQGNAYATHRGEVQNAGAQRLATQKEAAYKEQVAKQTADQGYGEFLYKNAAAFNTERDKTYASLYNSAAEGATIDSIMQDGRWGDLTPEQQKAVTNAAAEYSRIKSEQENANAVQGMIDSGASADEIKGSDAYIGLSDTDRTSADKLITERDEQKKLAIDALIENMSNYSSLKEVESELVSEMVPESERATVISGWQKRNADEIISELGTFKYADGQLSIGGEAITAADLYAGIKAGLYGDNADTVIKTYINSVIKTAGSDSATLADTVWAREELSYLENELYNDRGDTDKLARFLGTQDEKIKSVYYDVYTRPASTDSYEIYDGLEEDVLKFKIRERYVEVPELNKYAEGKGTSSVLVYKNGAYYLNNLDFRTKKLTWTKLSLVK